MTELTSISSVPSRTPKGMVSHRVAEVDAVCRDGSRELVETMGVEGGIFL